MIMKLIETGLTPMTEPNWQELNLTEIVKGETRFEYYRAGQFYYNVLCPNHAYRYPIPREDLGTGAATLYVQEKAINHMRWIRKAIEDKTLQEFVPIFMQAKVTTDERNSTDGSSL